MRVQTTKQNQIKYVPPPNRKLTPEEEARRDRIREKLVPAFTDLKDGETLNLEFYDGSKFILEGTEAAKPKSLSGIKAFLTAATQEIQVAVASGPSLAVTALGEGVKPVILNGVPWDVTSNVEQWYTPAVRGISVLLSMQKFIEGWKANQVKKDAGIQLTTIDHISTAANGLHMVTSAVGLLGALGTAIPALAPLGRTGVGIGIAGDVGAFAVNWMQYANERRRIKLDNG